MKLRKLKRTDAPLMLEWMHDDSVVHDMRTDFSTKTLEDCINFIELADDDSEYLHLAVVDDNDEYMGTVSLKHIKDSNAEFGITVRKCAMGKGYSKYGMNQIINIGFRKLKLTCVYWCVDPHNERAIRFYDKNEYERCDCPNHVKWYTDEEKKRFIWYSVQKK